MYQVTLPPASTREDFHRIFEVEDEDTGEAVDISACDIVFSIRDPRTCSNVLTAEVSDGVTVTDTGVFEVLFTADQMRGLCAQTYDVGCTISDGDSTRQLIIGTLPVPDGIVP